MHRVTTEGKKKKKNTEKEIRQDQNSTVGKKSQNKSVIKELNKVCKCFIDKKTAKLWKHVFSCQ